MSSSTTSLADADPLLDGASRAFERKATLVTVVALTLGFGACLGLWLWSRVDESTAIRSLPPAERQELFRSTLHTLQGACAPSTRADGLEAFCNDQARFVLQFPECDNACQSQAKRAHTVPRR
jgi:hypothetical protein